MKKSIISLLTAFSIIGISAQEKSYFLSSPSLSPDGKTAYFAYDGDIWKADSNGGNASRITALDGEEINPRLSPDGKWLAFSSNQYGNYDVYVMPAGGGTIRQLTFHTGRDEMESWAWDSKTIYFTSNRNNNFGSFTTTIEGKTPQKLFNNYFNNTNGLVETPAGEYLFTSSSESAHQVQRKRYKGENNPDILGYNPKNNSFKQYTNYEGKDFNPSVDKNGIIYFISDENNGEYNLYKLENGKKTALTEFDTSIKKPFVSADGSKVIFERDYQLYTYDVASKKTTPLNISLNTNKTLEKAQNFNVENNISYYDVSPDGKKMAFISRGIIFVSDIEGKFAQQVSDGKEHAMEVKWLKDNRTLLYSQTYNGYQNWFTIQADGKGQPKQLTEDLRNNRSITFNSDLSKAVYLSGRDEVRLLDLKSFKSTTIVKDEIWAFQNSRPSFSPNDEYVLFSAKRNFELDIFIYNIKKAQTLNLTNTGVSEEDPVWSPNGKYIYFASDRTNPSYPLGMQKSNIYRMALDWFDEPFKSEKFDNLFTEEKKEEKSPDKEKDKKDKKEEEKNKEKKEEKEPVIKELKVNPDDTLDRIELVTDRYGYQDDPAVFTDDKKEILLFNSNQDNGKRQLYKKVFTDFEPAKSEKVFDKAAYYLTKNEKNLFALIEGNIYKTTLAALKPEKINIQYSFNKDLASEFTQMYAEAWTGVEENFYDEKFHGIDWKAKKEQYAKYLPYVHNRNDLRILLNDLLGELNSSHTGFSSTGKEETMFLNYFTNETGIIFKKDHPYTVESIVRKSPAYRSGVDIKPGDQLISVNGKKIDLNENIETYFTSPKKQDELVLTFNRDGKTITTKVHPISNGELKGLLYDDWIYNNHQRVDKLSNNRIAYSCMKNMSTDELDRFLLDMVEQENRKDAVILDLRYNTGGNVHDKVLNFLSQRPYLQWKYREGKITTQPNFAPSRKPIVLLINEASLSDAEMTAAGFKALKLGKIIGQDTYRWIIFTSAKGLVDGSSYRLPAWGTYTLDGQNLEKTGVKPDIYVKNTFMDRLQNNDPQLERAVQEILKDLKK
ncbi:Tol biopolymer transport system component/C-terminal processing protease CtpA/Prc [Chryseobacterium bernardetii]|uniref:Tol biopolymer transport system component/C-terminal processing protease CtpA/Prc n=1 Tax=Chryseobacterium bernardetii TaxID=1241978 RepID=A0ACC6IZR3_9FLAO|nr:MULTISPECIES: S41 family peptidase [Chryseobacterium]MDR6372899.1 Tol biopolymer transport system component/C-terminal processing protease CtpA/Prc [Chryseobacterium vietnamense]MDR6443117.1 Tol biopolymer transport system component/C-terminal processing protease CtpA/Prc [Chryseobacterium bernardetii]